ncbi:hypothetical protein, partial [Pseudomonas syringae]|uniref:hypothetical protein n=1 Tax=Pseudomonas syringae TaxID=317 RepID=UPI001E4664B8
KIKASKYRRSSPVSFQKMGFFRGSLTPTLCGEDIRGSEFGSVAKTSKRLGLENLIKLFSPYTYLSISLLLAPSCSALFNCSGSIVVLTVFLTPALNITPDNSRVLTPVGPTHLQSIQLHCQG